MPRLSYRVTLLLAILFSLVLFGQAHSQLIGAIAAPVLPAGCKNKEVVMWSNFNEKSPTRVSICIGLPNDEFGYYTLNDDQIAGVVAAQDYRYLASMATKAAKEQLSTPPVKGTTKPIKPIPPKPTT